MKAGAGPALVLGGGLALLLLAMSARPARAAPPRGTNMELPITDWMPTLLRKTSEHEGTYWSVQRNLDGNGVSYGILQWTQKSGSLGRLLAAMYAADADSFKVVFGSSWAKVLEVTRRSSLEPVDGVALWSGPWPARFEAAGRYPVFQRVQVEEATRSDYLQGAVSIAQSLGVVTERALVMTFNRTVHMGVEGATGPARRLLAWYNEDSGRRPAKPNDVLAQYAWMCAGKFRRTTPPEKSNYNADGNLWWQQVAEEWSELKAGGDYRVRRVVASGVWHVVTGPKSKPWSLYDLITKRSSDILTDPGLRDVGVELGARVA